MLLSFLLHRQDFRKPNFTPKKTTKITKNTKNVSEKVIYMHFFHSFWKNLHLTENFYTDMSVVSVTNKRYGFICCLTPQVTAKEPAVDNASDSHKYKHTSAASVQAHGTLGAQRTQNTLTSPKKSVNSTSGGLILILRLLCH